MTKFSCVGRLITKIWSPVSKDEDNESLEDNDPNMWYEDLKKHAFGEFSFAVVQANEELEDYSQVEIGQDATFFGIYDGHGGPQASKYVCDNLFPKLIRNNVEVFFGGKSDKNDFVTVRRVCQNIKDAHDSNEDDNLGGSDPCVVWYRDLEKQAFGEFSLAVVQANTKLQDFSQVEVGRNGTFIGIYDGHGGTEASKYISRHLFPNLIRDANKYNLIYDGTILNAILNVQKEFLTFVHKMLGKSPLMATVGSCCLAGMIWRKRLYIGNIGDSRAIIGRVKTGRRSSVVAKQITVDHNVSNEAIRHKLQLMHPNDPQILVRTQGGWRIRGVIQASRTIGDEYLKSPEFDVGRQLPRFFLEQPIKQAVVESRPDMFTRDLGENDKFLVFASNGLWEHVTNEQVVNIVHNNPKRGIARRLLTKAMKKAAKKANKRYSELRTIECGSRRAYHDDITVVVVFIDHELLNQNVNNNLSSNEQVSVRGFCDAINPSMFKELRGCFDYTDLDSFAQTQGRCIII